jgi:hypothetical protein
MAWKELFSTDIGLLSIGTIVFILGMAGFFVRYFTKKMVEDAQNKGN